MTAYKLTESTPYYEAGRMFCNLDTHVVLLATPTKPQAFVDSYTIRTLQAKGIVAEVQLEDEKKIHPHLYKPIKLKLG